jgi:hypothetical protein
MLSMHGTYRHKKPTASLGRDEAAGIERKRLEQRNIRLDRDFAALAVQAVTAVVYLVPEQVLVTVL